MASLREDLDFYGGAVWAPCCVHAPHCSMVGLKVWRVRVDTMSMDTVERRELRQMTWLIALAAQAGLALLVGGLL